MALLEEAALLFGFAALLLVVVYFSWGAGIGRFLALMALCAWTAWATRRRVQSVFGPGQLLGVLAALAVVLLVAESHSFVRSVRKGQPCVTDMGRPSICAGEWLLRGLDPWAECAPQAKAAKTTRAVSDTYAWCLEEGPCIDYKGGGRYRKWKRHGAGFDFMDGYKYGPLMALLYLPATHEHVEAGLYAVNYLFWLATIALTFWLARVAYPHLRGAGYRAVVVLLLPDAISLRWLLPKVRFRSFGHVQVLTPPGPGLFMHIFTAQCANDVIPVAFVLAAVLLALRGRSLLAGMSLGLSLAAKILPAALVGLLLLRLVPVRQRRLLTGAALTAGLVHLPFFLWAPREMAANLLLFNLVRPTNSSSIRRWLPHAFESLVSLTQIAVVAGCLWFWYRARTRDSATFFRTAALLLIVFVALSKVVHNNYLWWIQPFAALALAGSPFLPDAGRDPTTDSPPATLDEPA
jgi:hypothetical protein